MLRENEVVMLILGVGAGAILLFNRVHIKKIKSWQIILSSYFVLLTGWICNVAEGFALNATFNFIEHISYTISIILLIIWGLQQKEKPDKEEIR